MSDIKTRKYRCNGCGEDRPCYLTTNQEPHTLDYMQIDDLKCVLDATNQTSFNWKEVEANGADTSQENNALLADVRLSLLDIKFIKSLLPEWAKTAPKGLDPTFYGTGSQSGDQKVVDRINKILGNEA